MNEAEPIKLQMMAFLDDELTPSDRVLFMEKCYADAALATELAKYRRLHDITQSMRLREPEDYEYDRFRSRLMAQVERRVGFTLFGVGLLSLVGCGIYYLLSSDLPAPVKVSATTTFLGLAVLTWHVLRHRLSSRRLDRYQGVVR